MYFKLVTRNLRVPFVSRLKFVYTDQVLKISFFQLRLLARVEPFLSRKDLERAVHAFISSRLDYCNSLWSQPVFHQTPSDCSEFYWWVSVFVYFFYFNTPHSPMFRNWAFWIQTWWHFPIKCIYMFNYVHFCCMLCTQNTLDTCWSLKGRHKCCCNWCRLFKNGQWLAWLISSTN